MLGAITDEVVPWEVNQQCNLMNPNETYLLASRRSTSAGIAKGKVLRMSSRSS